MVTAKRTVGGDLKLLALGPGGAPEKTYQLPIVGARLETTDGTKSIDHDGSTLKALQFEKGKSVRLVLTLPEGTRFRLGVE